MQRGRDESPDMVRSNSGTAGYPTFCDRPELHKCFIQLSISGVDD
jgi:hypothetical protein